MKITGGNNLFSNSYINTTKKMNTSSSFALSLQQQVTVESDKAADLTAAVQYFDKAMEKSGKENSSFSKTQIEYLKNRYNIGDMEITNDKKEYYNENGNLVTERSGQYLSEAHNNLVNDLHELGIMSDREMEILKYSFSPQIIPAEIMDANPNWQKFFNDSLNPNWQKDIAGYHRAMAEMHLETYEWLERKNMTSIGIIPKEWYKEAAEARNDLADNLAQIFN